MKNKRKRFMTLAEHDALLKAGGRYEGMIELQRQQDEAHLRRVAELRRVEEPLVKELNAAGYAVQSAWDLVNTSNPYPKALPILMEHLSRPYPGPVREGIARALAVPESKFAWTLLTKMYGGEQDSRAKDGLACAIAAAADDDVIDHVIELARDTRHGSSRLLLLSALERSTAPRARAALMQLGTDPQLKKEIQIILRRLKRRKR